MGLLEGVTFGLLALLPLFAAGLPTPLDLRRRAGQSLGAYRALERTFGFSVQAGHRYTFALGVAALVLIEAGLRLWGGEFLADWSGPVALAFLPILAAVWAFGVLTRLTAVASWPQTGAGRKLAAVLLVVAINLGLVKLGSMLCEPGKDPPAIAEAVRTLTVFYSPMQALSPGGEAVVSPLMKAIDAFVPLPIIAAAFYVVVGFGLKAVEGRRAHRP